MYRHPLAVGALCGALAWIATSCGEPKDPDVEYQPAPQGPPAPPAPDDGFAAVKPLVDANCGKCHDGVKQTPKFDTAAAFKGSKAKARLMAATMPPAPATISASDKAKLLAYLGG